MSVRTALAKGGLGTPSAAERPAKPSLTSRQRWILAVACVAQFMVILDLTIVNVALPSIQSSLSFSSIDLQWVVDTYAIAFAGFLMLGGRASDQYGQRRTLVVALVAFSLASLAGGLSVNHQMLIIARGAQGIAAALMAAASLATITASFEQGPARHRAIALWGAMNGAGGAAGTLFGGVLTQELGWRWVLLINPPIGIAAAIIAVSVVVDRRSVERKGFDLLGAVVLTAGLMLTAYGVITGASLRWDAPGAVIPFVIGCALMSLFPVVEARLARAPLVPPKLVRGLLRDANVIVLLFSAALFPMWYLSSLYLQQVLGDSPLAAGLTFLPMALVIMVAASRAGRLVGRFGVRAVLGSGLVFMTVGMLLFARIGSAGSSLGYVTLPGIVVAAGIGLSIVPSTIAATQSARPEQAGLASGLVNTSRQVGGAAGIALLISLASVYTSHLIGLNRSVPDSLTDGFRIGYLIGAGFAAAAAVVTFVRLPGHETSHEPSASRSRRFLPSAVLASLVLIVGLDFAFAGKPGDPIGAYTTDGAYTFVSAPTLHPPKIAEVAPHPDLAKLSPGYIMIGNFFNLTPTKIVGQSGPLIIDDNLQPVWFHPVPTNVVSSNLSLQSYHGAPALAWWQGVVTGTGATESGEDIIVNQHYQTIATIKGQDGWIITLHGLQIVGDDVWVTANKNIPMDLANYGGATDGALTDSAVLEYSLSTGKLLRIWDAYQHIPVTDSYSPPPTNSFPWDAYHVNSLMVSSNGTILVSMRNTWAAYEINIATGKIEWQLGGKHSDFTFGPNAAFQWQHDVVLKNDQLTLFDDHCCEITGAGTYLHATGPSRGLVLNLDLKTRHVTLVSQYSLADGGDAAYMGDTEVLGNGNVVVGWGALPYFSEYTKSGKLLLEGQLPGPDLSYRAEVEPWVGLPLYPPSGAARRAGGSTTVYASWNGATQVTAWRLLAGSVPGQLSPLARSARHGFETAMTVSGSYRYFELQALDSSGKVLGTSKPFTLKGS